jgi:hypothetical protein
MILLGEKTPKILESIIEFREGRVLLKQVDFSLNGSLTFTQK